MRDSESYFFKVTVQRNGPEFHYFIVTHSQVKTINICVPINRTPVLLLELAELQPAKQKQKVKLLLFNPDLADPTSSFLCPLEKNAPQVFLKIQYIG